MLFIPRTAESTSPRYPVGKSFMIGGESVDYIHHVCNFVPSVTLVLSAAFKAAAYGTFRSDNNANSFVGIFEDF